MRSDALETVIFQKLSGKRDMNRCWDVSTIENNIIKVWVDGGHMEYNGEFWFGRGIQETIRTDNSWNDVTSWIRPLGT